VLIRADTQISRCQNFVPVCDFLVQSFAFVRSSGGPVVVPWASHFSLEEPCGTKKVSRAFVRTFWAAFPPLSDENTTNCSKLPLTNFPT
jgi:hypothetical protein